jgi:hypothetical protein
MDSGTEREDIVKFNNRSALRISAAGNDERAAARSSLLGAVSCART